MIFFFEFWQKIDIKTKKNKINSFNFVLYYQIIRMAYVCIKTEKRNHFIAFHVSFIPKRWKNSQNVKKKHAFCFMVAMAMEMPK